MPGYSATVGALGLRRTIVVMTAILVLGLVIALAALAPRYGKDSRDLRDHPWESRNR